MVTSRAQFQICQVTLFTHVGKNGGIPIEFLISPAYPFLLRFGVIKRADVDVQRHQIAVAGSDRRGKPPYYPGRLIQDNIVEGTPGAVQPLPEGRTGWYRIQFQGLKKKGVIPKGLDSIEVGLPQTNEPDHGGSYLTVADLREWVLR